ncbi:MULTISPECIES: cation:proton antiporter [Rhizobium]|uniref:Sodium:proton antiporter n=1 Tax=Rhizobium wuzhouense TaxID=1986026 RepID=A0ABX5NV36_9HYPH|nr:MULTISPECIES: cation:proton antiporter [Rhizobium]PYB76974.1 sodium:proton antiporter [Rhizobium wuzhouense]RKE85616.1 multicomponent Na+:H+ antiporter subunit F [Rhizobium sp. AG855]
MTPELIVDTAGQFALAVLVLATLLTVWRAVVGPTLPDRVVALDMLVGIVIGLIAVFALRTGYTLYVDIAIALGLVGFLATVAFARFILARGTTRERPGQGASGPQPAAVSRAAKANAKPSAGKPAKSAAGKGGKA